MKHPVEPILAGLTADTRSRLERFAALLTRWNQRINLVAPRDLPNLWTRHIEDSLQLIPLLPPGAAVIDLGSGGGFPD